MFTVNGIGTMLYGKAKREELTGAERAAAEHAGYIPESYQVTKWFVVLQLPILPLGTYRVLKSTKEHWNDHDEYSMTDVEWDWKQIGVHYGVAYGWIVALVILAQIL